MVVYKVDRLTRSLTDFAKLVELFDANQVSFVSITQAFNTTTSMGRLTLNIATRDGRSERQIRILLNLAFLPPSQVKAILNGSAPIDTITNVARRVPMEWPELAAA